MKDSKASGNSPAMLPMNFAPPLALLQAQMDLFSMEHPDVDDETRNVLDLIKEQTERMSQMTKILLEMSELNSVPCEDAIELAPMVEEIFTDLAPLAEEKHIALSSDGDAVSLEAIL